ncbi:PorV/PorQ family protein [Elusimicrobiota bacterium]
MGGVGGRSARVALAAALLCAPLRPCAAGDFSSQAVGTAGSEWLNIGVDPRGMAMGNAFIAETREAFSMYWNPAGLSMIPRVSASAMHNEYIAGIRIQYAAYAQRITDTSVLGGAVRYMDAGSVVNTDIHGHEVGTFRPRNYVYEFGWGQSITDLTDAERDISLGVTARYFHSDLITHADGFAGDLGIQSHFTEAYVPYNFAVVLQNLGSGQKFDEVRDSLPFQAKLGTSVRPKDFLLFTLDGIMPVSNKPYAALGTEIALDTPKRIKVLLRAGYNSRNTFSGLEGLRGFSFGTGTVVGDLSFDYAFAPFGILGNIHRFSFSYNLPAKHSRRYRSR